MIIRILGCSGGIGGKHLRTTSMLVDDDVLIDAGTGVGDLTLAELTAIDHVFLTHSHLDHTVSIPFLVDAMSGTRTKPLEVHALPETIEVLARHIFNWKVWPDFTVIPSPAEPVMRYVPLAIGDSIEVNGRRFTALPANHTVPAVGYAMTGEDGATLVYTGDTTHNDGLWSVVNRIDDLRYLLIETAFCNRERELAEASKHLCPSMLAEELSKLENTPEIFITHLKPGEIERTMQEIEEDASEYHPRMLQNGHVFAL